MEKIVKALLRRPCPHAKENSLPPKEQENPSQMTRLIHHHRASIAARLKLGFHLKFAGPTRATTCRNRWKIVAKMIRELSS
jgi:hypothetical protein